MRPSEILRQKTKTVYGQLAEKHGVSVDYVGKIARLERTPSKKKGLAIKKDIELLTK